MKKIEGIVVLGIVIDEGGRVARTRIIQSVPLLDAAAVAAVEQWIFAPATKQGRAVACIARAPGQLPDLLRLPGLRASFCNSWASC